MKFINRKDLQAGKWYLLYNPIQDTPFKEIFILRMKGSDKRGDHFEESIYRFAIGLWKDGVDVQTNNQTAILHKNVYYKNLFIYELSDEEIGVHVIAEYI